MYINKSKDYFKKRSIYELNCFWKTVFEFKFAVLFIYWLHYNDYYDYKIRRRLQLQAREMRWFVILSQVYLRIPQAKNMHHKETSQRTCPTNQKYAKIMEINAKASWKTERGKGRWKLHWNYKTVFYNLPVHLPAKTNITEKPVHTVNKSSSLRMIGALTGSYLRADFWSNNQFNNSSKSNYQINTRTKFK